MPKLSFHALRIEDLQLAVRLGCSEQERSRPQEVRVTVELRFSECPSGAWTDSLNDAICYAKLSDLIQKTCESREYQLIERLAYEVYGLARELAGPGVESSVSIHKVRPPVEKLRGGAFFRCGDFAL